MISHPLLYGHVMGVDRPDPHTWRIMGLGSVRAVRESTKPGFLVAWGMFQLGVLGKTFREI